MHHKEDAPSNVGNIISSDKTAFYWSGIYITHYNFYIQTAAKLASLQHALADLNLPAYILTVSTRLRPVPLTT